MVNDACNPPPIWLLLISQNVACLRRKNHHEPVIHYHDDIWQPSTSTPPWTNMHQPCAPAFTAGLPSDKQHDICATVSRVCAWAGRSNQKWMMGKNGWLLLMIDEWWMIDVWWFYWWMIDVWWIVSTDEWCLILIVVIDYRWWLRKVMCDLLVCNCLRLRANSDGDGDLVFL